MWKGCDKADEERRQDWAYPDQGLIDSRRCIRLTVHPAYVKVGVEIEIDAYHGGLGNFSLRHVGVRYEFGQPQAFLQIFLDLGLDRCIRGQLVGSDQ